MKHVFIRRQNLYLQNARHYSPSSHYQASKPSPRLYRSRSIQPPAVPPQSRKQSPKVSRAPQTSKMSPEPCRSRHVILPPVPSKSQPKSSHDPQTSQNTSFRGPYPKFRWRSRAQNHRYIVRALVIIGCGTVALYCTSQHVPITERRQLGYVPRWLEEWVEKVCREDGDEHRRCSWGSEHPDMQGPISTFNRLLYAFGLDGGEWEFRVVQSPGK